MMVSNRCTKKMSLQILPVQKMLKENIRKGINTVELQWLEHLWNHENMFEKGVVRANEC